MVAREVDALRSRLAHACARFADFASVATDWWWETDADLRLTYVSDRITKLLGIKREDVIGRKREDFGQLDANDPKWPAQLALVEARKPFRNFETTLVDGAGVTRRIVISGLPVFDSRGAFAGYRGVGLDVTDLRRHETEAERRMRVLEATLENLDEGIALVDKTLRVIAFNRRLLDYLRLPEGAIRPGDPFEKILRELAAAGQFGDEDPETAVQWRLKVVRSRKPTTTERATAGGRVLEIRTDPMPDGGFVLRYNDVTDARRREAVSRQAQKMEALGQLTGGIAHDFNNLLTVVIGSAEQMREANDKQRLKRLAETILRAAERGSELSRRLLAFARRQPLAPRTTDVNLLLDGMQGMLSRTIGEQIEVRFVPDPKLPPAHVDPGQLETSILNLAINARDAMPNGGRLTIETRKVHIGAGFPRGAGEPTPGDWIVVAVSDTGTGMTPEIKERAFDPFFTTKGMGKGSGLGLSMVYGFVHQSGGHVTLYSEPAIGTTVKLYFPPAVGEVAGDAPAAASDPPRGTETVLLVEDDPMVRRHVEGLLGGLGYRTIVAETGAAALEILAAGTAVDVVFTDMVLPGAVSGRDLADAARRLRPGVKILFTSGYSNEMFPNVPAMPGAEISPKPLANFLPKPFRRRDMALKLRAVLDT